MGLFLKDIQGFIKTTELKTHKIVREITEDTVASLVDLSPVDTGNFVTNWLIGKDENIPWGVTGTKNSNGNEAKNYTINKIIAQIPVNAASHNYNIVNNTKYANKLETGEGMKTPAYAMVGITKLRLPGIVRRVLNKYGAL